MDKDERSRERRARGAVPLFHLSIIPSFHRLCEAVLLAAVLLFLGCRSAPSENRLHRFEFSSPHMGTLFKITLYAQDKTAAEAAAEAAFHRVAVLDDMMSDYQADSELMRLCQQPPGAPVPVSAELFEVLERARKFSELSNGAFDVTVGPYVRLWRMARKK